MNCDTLDELRSKDSKLVDFDGFRKSAGLHFIREGMLSTGGLKRHKQVAIYQMNTLRNDALLPLALAVQRPLTHAGEGKGEREKRQKSKGGDM